MERRTACCVDIQTRRPVPARRVYVSRSARTSPFQPKSSPQDLNAYAAELDVALAQGLISEDQWYEMRSQATAAAYLPRTDPRGQSGYLGDEARWRYVRTLMILDAIHKDGAFLDVGCANGYLIEGLHNYVLGTGLNVEFYGLDICGPVIELARRRLPTWYDRFFTANAVTWTPPRRFDFVHAHEISYAPANRRREFVEHLLNEFLAPGGRLILGPWTLGPAGDAIDAQLASWGLTPTGYLIKCQSADTGLNRKMVWIDRA